MIRRGSICWVDLGLPSGSRPAKRRPVLVVQAESYNRSHLATVIVAVVSSNTELAAMAGNVFLPAVATGLPRDSVVNVTGLVTVNASEMDGPVGDLPASSMHAVDAGLRQVLGL